MRIVTSAHRCSAVQISTMGNRIVTATSDRKQGDWVAVMARCTGDQGEKCMSRTLGTVVNREQAQVRKAMSHGPVFNLDAAIPGEARMVIES